MGSFAPPPENVLICSTPGPHPVKIRPCRPRVSHATRDAELPERSGSTGWDTVGGIWRDVVNRVVRDAGNPSHSG